MKIIPYIKKGLIIFFPSYNAKKKVLNYWTNSEILKRLKEYKKIIEDKHKRDDCNIIQKEFEDINKDETNNGAILLSVWGGAYAEGINFHEESKKLIIIIGIPLL